MIDASFIIISYNTPEFTLGCVQSIFDTAPGGLSFEIIIVDNASNTETKSAISNFTFPVKVLFQDANLGYSKAINIGCKAATGKILFLCNSDITFHENSIQTLFNLIGHDKSAGVACAMQLFPSGKYQHSFGDFPGIKLALKKFSFFYSFERLIRKLLFDNKIRKPRKRSVGYCDGAMLATRNSVFFEAGGFDEDYFFFSEETDFCWKLSKMGLKRIFEPRAVITHYRGGSSEIAFSKGVTQKMLVESKLLFCNKRLNKFSTILYILSEKYFSKSMFLLYNLLYIIGKKKKQKEYLLKAGFFAEENSIWHELPQLLLKNQLQNINNSN